MLEWEIWYLIYKICWMGLTENWTKQKKGWLHRSKSIKIMQSENHEISKGKKKSFNDMHACMHARSLQCVPLFVTPWTVAHQVPLSMGFSRQEYWSGLPCPPPGDLPNPGIKPVSLMSPMLTGSIFTTSTTWEIPSMTYWTVLKSPRRKERTDQKNWKINGQKSPNLIKHKIHRSKMLSETQAGLLPRKTLLSTNLSNCYKSDIQSQK